MQVEALIGDTLVLKMAGQCLDDLIRVVDQIDLVREDMLEGLQQADLDELRVQLQAAVGSLSEQEAAGQDMGSISLSSGSLVDLDKIFGGALSVEDDAFDGISDDTIVDLARELAIMRHALKPERTIRLIENRQGIVIPRIPEYSLM